MMFYRLVDDIAEHYLDLVDALDEEIDELEDNVETSPARATRVRLSASSATTCCTSAAHLLRRAMQFAAWSTTSSR